MGEKIESRQDWIYSLQERVGLAKLCETDGIGQSFVRTGGIGQSFCSSRGDWANLLLGVDRIRHFFFVVAKLFARVDGIGQTFCENRWDWLKFFPMHKYC